MWELKLTRYRLLGTIAAVWAVGVVAVFVLLAATRPEPTVEVVHWATGHLMREGELPGGERLRLLPVMAEEFNRAGHTTRSGKRIIVKVHNVPSELQAEYLVPRVTTGRGPDLVKLSGGYVLPGYSDPTIVTPSSAHWLVTVNYEVGRTVVDIGAAESIVLPVIGIVTHEEMARCLGWPEKEIGYADIIALRSDPRGWEAYPCAKAEWGKVPLVAFTDPTTSSTGRSVLLALYSFATGRPPEELTLDDVNDPGVIAYVKEFQGLIDHYTIGTTMLNTMIHQGPRYGHFFIMPEDNLIHLYEGTERAFVNGKKVTPPPLSEVGLSMVMIYPREGSMPRSNCACIVQGDWVSEEQAEAAQKWTEYLLEDEQQRSFMAAGFRPGTDIPLTDPASKISARYGLDPTKPTAMISPALIKPEVAAAIDQSWEFVKKPGIVTLVVDTSGSMRGDKLKQARIGVLRFLDNIASNNQVGLVTFDDAIKTMVLVAPLAESRFKIAEAAEKMRARGETALYNAIKTAIEMTDAAPGDRDAIRGVVVLTDGRANSGSVRLDDLIRMMSCNERHIATFGGMEGDSLATDEGGTTVTKECVIGTELAFKTRYPVQVFFIGIGDDADLDVGRIIAQATGAGIQGVAEEDLAKVLAEFSRYF